MENTIESMKSAPGNDENKLPQAPVTATVQVYGHGPTKNPFYEEAKALNATSKGALLILTIPLNRGQKLLLINRFGQDPAEAEVTRTRTLEPQMFEVEIAFPFPRLNFWAPAHGDGKARHGAERRRSPRIGLKRGMTISWEGPYRHDISRVSSLSLGGLFIDADDPAPAGQILRVQFDIPAGPVLAKAVVRRSIKGKGMGVEFTELPTSSRAGLNELLLKLLGDPANRRS